MPTAGGRSQVGAAKGVRECSGLRAETGGGVVRLRGGGASFGQPPRSVSRRGRGNPRGDPDAEDDVSERGYPADAQSAQHFGPEVGELGGPCAVVDGHAEQSGLDRQGDAVCGQLRTDDGRPERDGTLTVQSPTPPATDDDAVQDITQSPCRGHGDIGRGQRRG